MRRLPLLPAAGATICSGLSLHPVFAWLDLAPVVLPAALVPTGIALLMRSRPLWMPLITNLAAWVVAVYVLFGSAFSTTAAISGLRNGWRAILATLPPLPGKPDLLILVLTVTWLGALAGAEIVLRTRHPVLAMLPNVAVFALACLLTAGSNGYLVGGLAVTAGLLILRRSRWGYGLALIAGSTAVATLALALLPWPARLDTRQHLAPPDPGVQKAISPLDLIAPWLRNPDRELFSVQSAQPVNWRLAVFDMFDGANWSSSGVFQPTGGTVPPVHKGPLRRDRMTIANLPGPWLPAADRPAAITGLPVRVDPATGVLISVEALRPGMRYEVASSVPAPDPASLRTAATATDPVVLPQGEGVAELRAAAQKATSGAAYPYQQAAMLEQHLRENYSYDPNATPGHNLRALNLFVSTTQRGTPEQFATSFAVMARTLGLPSRVVVGFRPGQEQAGTWYVRTGDVLAWPEVHFANAGWVPFFPTPDKIGRSTVDTPGAGATPQRQELNRQVVQEAIQQPVEPAVTSPSGTVSPGLEWRYLLAVPVLYVAMVLVVPAWRRRRQRQLSAPDQIAVTWRRAGRLLAPLLTEVPHLSSLTNSELALAGVSVLGEASRVPLTTLATLADQSLFSHELLTPRLAALAWERLRTLERLTASPLSRLHPRRFVE